MRERRTGVRCATPLRRTAAARTSSRVTGGCVVVTRCLQQMLGPYVRTTDTRPGGQRTVRPSQESTAGPRTCRPIRRPAAPASVHRGGGRGRARRGHPCQARSERWAAGRGGRPEGPGDRRADTLVAVPEEDGPVRPAARGERTAAPPPPAGGGTVHRVFPATGSFLPGDRPRPPGARGRRAALPPVRHRIRRAVPHCGGRAHPAGRPCRRPPRCGSSAPTGPAASRSAPGPAGARASRRAPRTRCRRPGRTASPGAARRGRRKEGDDA
ncbi:hypothetical protein SGRIM128S_08858 [Streptomyces griseomycini]